MSNTKPITAEEALKDYIKNASNNGYTTTSDERDGFICGFRVCTAAKDSEIAQLREELAKERKELINLRAMFEHKINCLNSNHAAELESVKKERDEANEKLAKAKDLAFQWFQAKERLDEAVSLLRDYMKHQKPALRIMHEHTEDFLYRLTSQESHGHLIGVITDEGLGKPSEPESPWIRVQERLPEVDQAVLFYDGEDIYNGRYVQQHPMSLGYAITPDRKWFQVVELNTCLTIKNVTHWMPLPAPPSTDKK